LNFRLDDDKINIKIDRQWQNQDKFKKPHSNNDPNKDHDDKIVHVIKKQNTFKDNNKNKIILNNVINKKSDIPKQRIYIKRNSIINRLRDKETFEEIKKQFEDQNEIRAKDIFKAKQ